MLESRTRDRRAVSLELPPLVSECIQLKNKQERGPWPLCTALHVGGRHKGPFLRP